MSDPTGTDYKALTEVARARYKLACDEMDRLTTGNPGNNWRWSIPADPARDSDLILSASADDVPRLADAVEALLAEEQYQRRTKDAALGGLGRYEKRLQKVEAERDALQAQIEHLQAAFDEIRSEYAGYRADRKREFQEVQEWVAKVRAAKALVESGPCPWVEVEDK